MALFYTGPRPVLKGRNSDNMVNPYKGTSGTYSHYPLYSASHVLDGAPTTNYTPGSGNYPNGLALSRAFAGLEDAKQSLNGSGDGARVDGMRFRPLENRSATGAIVFGNTFGHQTRATDYSYNRRYEHTYRFQRVNNPGHTSRTDVTGAPSSFGAFAPYGYKGVTESALLGADAVGIPSGYDNLYGKNKVNEWRGIPSSRAL
jgi:hypothetical protein